MKTVNYGHYTSLSGLLGIVKAETLWATNIKFLNDEQEFQHALDMIKEIISKSKITSNNPTYSLNKKFISDVTEKLKSLDSYEADSVFTLSFSEQTDLLSQWRGYCPDNNGYCVVFDADILLELANSNLGICHLVKCVYDKKQKEDQIKKLLNNYWSKYVELKNDDLKKSLLEDLTSEIMLLASYFKHQSFEEEKEHRIVILLEYAPDNDLKFREGHFSLIPYIELQAPRKHIKKICIGPTANKELAKRALETFWEKCFGMPSFIGYLVIEFSKTPYRPW